VSTSGTEKLAYDVKVDEKTMLRALRLFKKKAHRGFHFKINELKGGMYHVQVYKHD